LPQLPQKPDGQKDDLKSQENRIDVLTIGISAAEEADLFLYNGDIGGEGYERLVSEAASSPSKSNCILILNTYGGDANYAFRIARFLQTNYEKFILIVPSFCKSAGTLLALGASELQVGDFGELGPLDVQLLKRDELGARKSGLITKSSCEALGHSLFALFESMLTKIKVRSGDLISFKTASDISAKMASSVMQPVFSQLDPDVMGEDHRDLVIARDYGVRLATYGGNSSPISVDRLVNSYPSHDFIIDRLEAGMLFFNVSDLTSEMYELCSLLGPEAYNTNSSNDVTVRLLSERRSDESSDASEPNEIENHDNEDEPRQTKAA
jgi:hypothetical protein